MLNRGSYGELQFFSQETFERMLPEPLANHFPGVPHEWGIGITWMRQAAPGAGENGVPTDATVLSRNTIGHGAASAAILRVDLDNELVVAQTRDAGGDHYGKYAVPFLEIIQEGLRE